MREMKVRKIDEDIYLNEDRSSTVKKDFRDLAKILHDGNDCDNTSVLDVGCASGELVHFLNSQFSNWKFSGFDVSEKMILKAKNLVPNASFFVNSAINPQGFANKEYDIVTCFGVLTIFDDLELPLNNILAAVKDGGRAVIFGNFNPDPVDVRVRVRRSDDKSGEWHTGYNCWSRMSYEKFLTDNPRVSSFEWKKFDMDQALLKRDDPLRVWTVETKENEHQQMRGTQQLVNQYFLEISLLD